MSRSFFIVLLLAGTLLAGAHQAVAETASRLGSVGLQVVPTSTGELAVLLVPAGTPAAAAGIRAGDLIVKLDDFTLAGSDFADVVSRHLWGPEGSEVTIHYLRPGVAGRKAVKLKRVAADPKLTVSPVVRNGAGEPKQGGKQ